MFVFLSLFLIIPLVCLITGCETTNNGTETMTEADAETEAENMGADLKITGVGTSSYMKALNLMVMPHGIYLDAEKGADAIAVQLFPQPTESYKFKFIQRGIIEFIVLDGAVQSANDDVPPVLQRWRYTPEDLKQYEKTSAVGECYEVLLVWDKDKQPKAAKVTVLARYIDPKGKVIYSQSGVVIL